MDPTTLAEVVEVVLARVLEGGATDAKVIARSARELSVKVRMGAIDRLEQSETQSIAVRAIKGCRVATCATSDLTQDGLRRLITELPVLHELAEEDPFAELPDPSELATTFADLRLFDPACGGLTAADAIALARGVEQAALQADTRITSSEGAECARTVGGFFMATSGGFRGGYDGSYVSLSVSPVTIGAGGTGLAASYWSANRLRARLEDEGSVGREAARRTLALLGARSVPSQEVPVVFAPDAARALLRAFASCVTGDAIWRGASFLVGRLGTRVASERVTFIDDPSIVSGPGSRPFDGDGLPARRNVVVEKGVLKTYLLDTFHARRLGMKSTGSAASATGVGAGTSNFFLEPGAQSGEEIVRSTVRGLYVTGLGGFGFNPTTGLLPRGAVGRWIERGELTHAVSGVTLSIGLLDLFGRVDAVGSDLDIKAGIASPTFRVERVPLVGT